MKKSKLRILWPISNCCLKKFNDLDTIAKYGSIFIVVLILLSQVFNIVIEYNIRSSIFSVIMNIFFLVVILSKLGMIKVSILEEKVDSILKFIILVLILDFLGYVVSPNPIYNYLFAPISFLGAYFIFILLRTK